GKVNQRQRRETVSVSEDIYMQIATAKSSNGGNHIRDGEYLFAVNEITITKGHTGVLFIAEFRVIEAKAVEVADTDRRPEEIGKVIAPNSVGSLCSSVLNFTKHQDTAPGNARKILVAIDGSDDDA